MIGKVVGTLGARLAALMGKLDVKFAFASFLAGSIQCAYACSPGTFPNGDWTVGTSGSTAGGDRIQLALGPGGAVTGTYFSVAHADSCTVPLAYTVSGHDYYYLHIDIYDFHIQANATGPVPAGCAPSILIRGKFTGAGCHTATIAWNNSLGASGTTTMSHPCYYPTSETTPVFKNWDSGDGETIAIFSQGPSPTNYNWRTRSVSEVSPQAGSDTCWFGDPEGPPKITTVTGGGTAVHPDSTYLDSIGASTGVVMYYRAHKRAPCGYAVYQSMRMQCDVNSTPITFKTHVDQVGIGTSAVTSVRAGVGVTRGWYPKAVNDAVKVITQFLLLEP